jgi:hypothetical protein
MKAMNLKINKLVKDTINSLGNKTKKTNGLKIYSALIIMSKRQNKHGYFPVPSTYLESINCRYKTIIDVFLNVGIIEYFKGVHQDPNDLFSQKYTKYYNTNKGICMKYRFLIDTSVGEDVFVDMNTNKKSKWYNILEGSLLELGYNPDIKRDTFGRRVHHNLIPVYKEELKDKGYALIDAQASQPKLLLNIMKQKGFVDTNYEKAFEGDFYNFLVEKLNLEDRKMAKDLFMYWLNSAGYVPDYKIHILFPVASNFIKVLKSKNYKDSSSFLQRVEAKIWIDDLLENLPTDFGIPIHDCLIVKDKQVNKILNYCKSKYPDIDFQVSYL